MFNLICHSPNTFIRHILCIFIRNHRHLWKHVAKKDLSVENSSTYSFSIVHTMIDILKMKFNFFTPE